MAWWQAPEPQPATKTLEVKASPGFSLPPVGGKYLMFEAMVVSSPHPTKMKKPLTVLLSAVFQTAFLGILILIPLIYTEALPKAMMATMLTAPPPPPPPPPPPAAVQVVHVKPQVHLMDAGKLIAPKVIPKETKIIKEDAEPDMSAGMSGGVPGGVAGGSMGGVLGVVIC